jgi:hypothetical protein
MKARVCKIGGYDNRKLSAVISSNSGDELKGPNTGSKFNAASVKRMARANAKDSPTQPLFHYTTEQAFYSIIQSETFWFTSIYYMDDDAELSFGFRFFWKSF